MSGTRPRGRPRTSHTGGKVDPTLSDDAIKCLDELVRVGRFGTSRAEVAKYFITRGLDEYTRLGVLPYPMPE
jgi:hypothetical protein